MQLDAVEARGLRALRGRGEQTRQRLRQIADVRQLHIGDAFAIAEAAALPILRGVRTRFNSPASIALRRSRAAASEDRIAQGGAVPVGDDEKPLEEFLRLRPAAHGEKVDELDKQPGAAAACAPHAFDQRRKPGRKRSWPMRNNGPLGTSRIPVASTTMAPGVPRANRSYQSMTSSVASPSSVARHGTMAGTQVRCSSVTGPMSTGENSRDAAASAADGMRPAAAV